MSDKAQIIPPDAYPQMVSPQAARAVLGALRSSATLAKAQAAIEDQGESLRAAVRGYATEMEAARGDPVRLLEIAHEIRGLAETGGLLATGRIAEGLCRYCEECALVGVPADAAVLTLYVDALARAAHDGDAARQMSDEVARELARLAARKLKDQTRLNAR